MKTRSLRVKRVVISPEDIWRTKFNVVNQCGGKTFFGCSIEGIPDDAVVENVYIDQMPLQFVYILSHPSWPEVSPEGLVTTEHHRVRCEVYRLVDVPYVPDEPLYKSVMATGEVRYAE